MGVARHHQDLSATVLTIGVADPGRTISSPSADTPPLGVAPQPEPVRQLWGCIITGVGRFFSCLLAKKTHPKKSVLTEIKTMDLKPEVWSIFLVQKRKLLFVAARDNARTRCKAIVLCQYTLAAMPHPHRSTPWWQQILRKQAADKPAIHKFDFLVFNLNT